MPYFNAFNKIEISWNEYTKKLECDGIYLENSLMWLNHAPRTFNKLSRSGINLVNMEEFLWTSLGETWGGDGSPHSSPWVVPGSLSQQVVFSREFLLLSIDHTRLPKKTGASHPFRMSSGNLLALCIVWYNFKSTCLRLSWSCFNSPVYGKDPKQLLWEEKWFWCKNEVLCVRMSSFVVLDKHSVAQLRRSPA